MQDDLKAILESILFVASEPVSPVDMKKLHGGAGIAEWKRVAADLMEEYEQRQGPIRVIEVAEGFKMVTRPEMAAWIRKFTKATASSRLSRPGLETLAIIAYRQPVIKAEVDAIRGVASDGVLKTLLDRKLVKILGRKEMPGRPLLYGTTREFLEYFGLKSISEMPTLKDLEEVPINPGALPGELQEALFDALPSADVESGGAIAGEDGVPGDGEDLPQEEDAGVSDDAPSGEPDTVSESSDDETEESGGTG